MLFTVETWGPNNPLPDKFTIRPSREVITTHNDLGGIRREALRRSLRRRFPVAHILWMNIRLQRAGANVFVNADGGVEYVIDVYGRNGRSEVHLRVKQVR